MLCCMLTSINFCIIYCYCCCYCYSIWIYYCCVRFAAPGPAAFTDICYCGGGVARPNCWGAYYIVICRCLCY